MSRLIETILGMIAVLLAGEPEMETARTAGFELDHFFVAVPSSETGSAALEEAGFLISGTNVHTGQGTASRGIIFENVYLELIWLASSEEAESGQNRRSRTLERVQGTSGACPFGIGLRRQGDAEVDLPFETWEYRPPYLPEGLFFLMGANSTEVSEPLVFFLPWLTGRSVPLQAHPNGTERVTNLELVLEGDVLESETLSALSNAGVAAFIKGADYLMKVELDDGQSGRALDLRPEIPLLIRW